jgi:hypothetical protein
VSDEKCGQPYAVLFTMAVLLGGYLAYIWMWT